MPSDNLDHEQRIYGTFGGRSIGFYVEIEATRTEQARQAMHQIFGRRWAFVYSYLAFREQPKQYDLRSMGVIKCTDTGEWWLDTSEAGLLWYAQHG